MPHTASITIDSTRINPAALAVIESILYGTATTAPRMPLPEEILAIVRGEYVPPPPDPEPVPTDPNAALAEDANDPGTYIIQHASLTEDSSDPGTYLINQGLTEDSADPGNYTIGAAA